MTTDQLKEVFLQIAIYAGVPAANTAIAIAKASFNAESEVLRGVSRLGFNAVSLYYDTDEAKEGGNAQREKRPPDFFGVRRRSRD